MEISVECDSHGLRCDAPTMHLHWSRGVKLPLPAATLSFFLFFFTALYTARYSLSLVSPRSLYLSPLYLSTSSGLTFRRRIALSSVVFIGMWCGWRRCRDERRGLLRRTAIRPGRLAARLRVNVLLVISGLATSSALSSSSFFSWSSAREPTPFSARRPATRPRPHRFLEPFEPDLHRAIGRASS